jgi:drug/metabolite transporter (DMT)-like permease
VLGKSAKPIPILILGVLLGGKVYPRMKYFIVLLIVIGVALFFYKDGGNDQGYGQSKFFNLIGFGEALIVSYPGG